MKFQLISLSAILTSVACVKLAAAAIATVIALLIAREGGSQEAAAIIAAAYSAGFLYGCFYATEPLSKVGHIRAFSAAAAICTIATLAMTAHSSIIFLGALRFVMGVATASLFAIAEAWVNDSTTRDNRGRVISIYAVTTGLVSIASQVVVFAFSEQLELSFTLLACLFSGAVIVLALARTEPPKKPQASKLSIRNAFNVAPIAAIGCLVGGSTVTTILTVLPYYLSVNDVSAGIIALSVGSLYLGSAVLQLPLGYFSDRSDRRIIILAATATGAVVLSAIFFQDPGDASGYSGELGRIRQLITFFGAFIVGGCFLSLYSLSTAHALDRASSDNVAQLTASYLFIWTTGSTAGPIVAALVTEFGGDDALIYFFIVIHAAYVVYVGFRLRAREPVPHLLQVRFTSTPTSSVVMAQTVAERQREGEQAG